MITLPEQPAAHRAATAQPRGRGFSGVYPWLLAVFVGSVVALSWGRWSGWGIDGFALYVTQPIMQTTLYDFAWVLAILTLFIHQDAKRHGLRYWYVFPTYPAMPTVGLLLYLWLRHRKLSRSGAVPPPGS